MGVKLSVTVETLREALVELKQRSRREKRSGRNVKVMLEQSLWEKVAA